jgi:large subunit ribosomal protein L4
METKLLNQEWKEVWVVELNESVFNVEVNSGLIHRALIFQLANERQNAAHTKTRWERNGSTRKLYKQKWTGRARAWSSRSPIRKKWWVAFGPRNNTNFTISMNRKERRLALFSLLSSKLKDNKIVVLDAINFSEIKTKHMVSVMTKIPYEKNVLLAIDAKNEVLEKSSSNIPNLKTLTVDYLNISDLLKYNTLVLVKESLNKINSLSVK